MSQNLTIIIDEEAIKLMGMEMGSNDELNEQSKMPKDNITEKSQIVDEVSAYIKSIDFFGLITIKCSS